MKKSETTDTFYEVEHKHLIPVAVLTMHTVIKSVM